MEEDEDSSSREHSRESTSPSTPLVSPIVTSPDTPDTPLDTPVAKKKRFKFAKVSFGRADALEKFVNAVNSPDGLYLGTNRIQIIRQTMVCVICWEDWSVMSNVEYM